MPAARFSSIRAKSSRKKDESSFEIGESSMDTATEGNPASGAAAAGRLWVHAPLRPAEGSNNGFPSDKLDMMAEGNCRNVVYPVNNALGCPAFVLTVSRRAAKHPHAPCSLIHSARLRNRQAARTLTDFTLCGTPARRHAQSAQFTGLLGNGGGDARHCRGFCPCFTGLSGWSPISTRHPTRHIGADRAFSCPSWSRSWLAGASAFHARSPAIVKRADALAADRGCHWSCRCACYKRLAPCCDRSSGRRSGCSFPASSHRAHRDGA